MARKAHNGSYEFVGIRDRGNAIIGPHDKIILKDSHGQRHEFYLGDDQALAFLKTLGVESQEINGLPWGRVQGKISCLYHIKKARELAGVGDSSGADAEFQRAEASAKLADLPDDRRMTLEIQGARGQIQP